MSTTTKTTSQRLGAGRARRRSRRIHEVLERHRVTEEEWHAALRFLTDVGRADEFVLLSDVTRTSVLIDAHDALGADETATASDVEGPLYREEPPWREAPVRIYEDYEGMGGGEVLFVRGRVTSTDGAPLRRRGHRHLADRARAAATTSGTSASRTSTSAGASACPSRGAYEFQTMVPKPYTVPTEGPVGRYLEAVGQHPWRPAHIHFKVTADGHKPLVTQVFFPDDPYLENDTIGAVKEALVRPLERHEDEAELAARGLDRPVLHLRLRHLPAPGLSPGRPISFGPAAGHWTQRPAGGAACCSRTRPR